MSMQKAYLLLENGTVFEGKSFGVTGTAIGEVVFTTGMTGYQETLTDPSYYGQIVLQTFPLNGNYGINKEDYESKKSYVNGYIVREWCELPSNFRSEDTIDHFLKEQNVIGLYNIDTRQLTRIIREKGVMNGMITTEDVYKDMEQRLRQIREYRIVDALSEVSVQKQEVFFTENAQYNVVMMDFGYKKHILDNLLRYNCNVTIVPYNTAAAEILDLHPDGIMLSNGPGNPADYMEIVTVIKTLIESGIPIFGICLGHQLTALAQGGETVKLKYGHRGANQPVKDLTTERIYITSQNHGYAVIADSINPSVGTLGFINVNDHTCEGINYHNAPVFTVQFHPEANGGPLDTVYLFERFIKLMKQYKCL